MLKRQSTMYQEDLVETHKTDAELVAEDLAESKGIDYDGLPVKERSKIYGRALDGLSKNKNAKRNGQS